VNAGTAGSGCEEEGALPVGALKDDCDPPKRLTPCGPRGGNALPPTTLLVYTPPIGCSGAVVCTGRMVGERVDARRICGEWSAPSCGDGTRTLVYTGVCTAVAVAVSGSGMTRTVLADDAMEEAEGEVT
jgi:hypothetical protein